MTEQIFKRLPRFGKRPATSAARQLRQISVFDSDLEELSVSPTLPSKEDLAGVESLDVSASLPSEPDPDRPFENDHFTEPVRSDSVAIERQPQSEGAGLLDQDPVENDSDQIEATGPHSVLEALMDELPRIEASARDEVVEVVEGIARQIFPKLAELFLAEEIVIHLRKLMPAKVELLKIRAPEPFASQLGEKLTDGQFGETVVELEVLASNSDEAPGIDISWERGGVEFDFRTFLEDCLQRLVQSRSIRGA